MKNINQEIVLNTIEQHPFFLGLSSQQKKELTQFVMLKSLDKNQAIMTEGELKTDIYFILQGEVAVRKHIDGHQQQITTLKEGDNFGEMAIIDKEPRSASVTSIKPTELMILEIDKLSLSEQHKDCYSHILEQICKTVTQKLRHTNEVTVFHMEQLLKEKTKQIIFGSFTISLIISLSIYITTLRGFFLNSELISSTTLTNIVLVIFLGGVGHFIWKNKLSIQDLTLDFKNVRANCISSMKYNLAFMVLFICIKIAVLTSKNQSLTLDNIFGFYSNFQSELTIAQYYLFIFIYVLFCPVQEFLIRGVIQNSLMRFLPHVTAWYAIIVSNLLFAALHIHKGYLFALFAFVPGIFWGWIYAKYRNLYPCIISHIIVGVFSIFIVGINFLK